MGGLEQRPQSCLWQESVEPDTFDRSDRRCESLDLTVERVLADDIELRAQAGASQRGETSQQRERILHAVEARHVNEAQYLADASHRRALRPGVEIDAERNAHRLQSEAAH